MIFFVLIPMTIGFFIGSLIAKTTVETFPDPLTVQLGFIPPPFLFIVAGVLMIPLVILLIWLKTQRRKKENLRRLLIVLLLFLIQLLITLFHMRKIKFRNFSIIGY